jgi:hypothetical protein
VESDPTLRAVQRNALVIAAAMTAAALFVRPRPQFALAVAAGALLVGVSYWTLTRGVSALAAMLANGPGEAPKPRRQAGRELWKLVLRYALLALLAYVMIARLRLHPWGLLAGASSVVAGVSVEAVRLLVRK